jgi:hypothetical protein
MPFYENRFKERILLAMRPHTHLPQGASAVTAVGSSTSTTLRAMPSDSAP